MEWKKTITAKNKGYQNSTKIDGSLALPPIFLIKT